MSNISVSKMKIFKDCKLEFKYKYIDKWVPTDDKKEDVTAKGLVMHQCFEDILKYENYVPGWDEVKFENTLVPCRDKSIPKKIIPEEEVLKILKTAMEKNKLSVQVAKEYRLKLGLKRWLSFKHDYLDKRNSILYAEKEHKLTLFKRADGEEVVTTAILDLLEELEDGNYCIYDYKTPQKANNSNYKAQLLVYTYVQATALGLIGSDIDFACKTIADKFKIYVFYPLLEGLEEDYTNSLKQVKFKAEDVKKAIDELKETDANIGEFDFSQNAVQLQPTTPKFTCDWCEYCGSKRQTINGETFEGCPITDFAGCICKHEFKRPEKKESLSDKEKDRISTILSASKEEEKK